MPRKICAWTGCRTFISRGKFCAKHAKMDWKRRNPDKVSTYRAAYRARVKNAPVVELISREKVYARDKGICGICGRKVAFMKWHMDHKHPVARGGNHTYANVQVSHPSCNQKKGAKIAA